MRIQKRIHPDQGYFTSLQSCSCPDFRFRGGSYRSADKQCCKHIRRLEQEITYFNSGWNHYAKAWLCLCHVFETEEDCPHIQALCAEQNQALAQ
ncbi:hypothetical protein COW36_19900 [bacterium (Candidatus Blackallbacteria) CG17_big_fil_post_rev_8_21_14_2_50_48_46]|uniref:SWIM-type domain-containing protein n=1 Tax=bacterium (Candidatus Blackallbacteria) CG17_big_fil_post_rev_8_21_14_2_50_48_46 TaxID=2014261 RepID=A0A2M7G030_9BACT|nr:MAG: hypothetical protein COW64_15395 [bacterium (Candidatus Blackallbacteria) CG18_big_fil_WC_8_21_14_2_50_49_26]PIW14913.1 MAG: hypothetical protein COW36_19900 [bacterium (Candidatus Blackallbacteria) CG17_big_fil_post_rev_8_21_14_2_50_48_46]PIW44299.1 MAG: hypothetical protein COW20_24460 [bacterium (Candidatus Blackallbacteria) CG13_big_fil_rev_8_21_14_2_50_49_14]